MTAWNSQNITHNSPKRRVMGCLLQAFRSKLTILWQNSTISYIYILRVHKFHSESNTHILDLKKKILTSFHQLLGPWINQPFPSRHQNTLSNLGQYRASWCPGSWRCQAISNHDIDWYWYRDVFTILETEFQQPLCNISVSRNDIKGEYLFMDPRNDLALKGLIKQSQHVTVKY